MEPQERIEGAVTEQNTSDHIPQKGHVGSEASANPSQTQSRQSFRDMLRSASRAAAVFEDSDDDEEEDEDEEDEDEDEDEDEEDFVDESAVEGDSEWEDSPEGSVRSSSDDQQLFRRVDSTAKIPTRRSLISLMFANGAGQPSGSQPSNIDRAGVSAAMGVATLSVPALGPISEICRPPPSPIRIAGLGQQLPGAQLAYSPRTTRRNMVKRELPESLRRSILWERESTSSHAIMRRSHTAVDVAAMRRRQQAQNSEGCGPGSQHAARDQSGPRKSTASSCNNPWRGDGLAGYHPHL